MAEVPGLVSVVHSTEAPAGAGAAAAAAGWVSDDDPLVASSLGKTAAAGGSSSSSKRSKQKQQRQGKGKGSRQSGKQQQQQQRGARALAVASSEVLAGVPYLVETLSDLQFHVSPHSFFQTNTKQAELLYDQVLQAVQQYYAAAGAADANPSAAAASTDLMIDGSSTAAELRQQQQQQQPEKLSGTVLDLYCGTGTISLILASRLAGVCRRVVGFDVSASSITDARANAARNGITNVEFACGDLTQLAHGELLGPDSQAAAAAAADDSAGFVCFSRAGRSGGSSSNFNHSNSTRSGSSSSSSSSSSSRQPDVVVVDPARAGLSKSVVDYLLRCGAQRVVYVSCNSATQARDLQLLCGGGDAAAGRFRLVSWRGVDMFPHTDHLETVVVLDRV
jgi:tRNA/tmRNA/rRNA uracil-C5-methylase (TrmA/RlmC/RlmD family)